MGVQRQLRAADGFAFGVYESLPGSKPRGGCVVIQEIFGVNGHIRSVADRFAQAGYASLAPQIFDRARRDVELGYSEDDIAIGLKLASQDTDREDTLRDLQASIEEAGKYGDVAVVGYCYGGLLAWLSSCQLTDVKAAVAYYGAGIANALDDAPTCSVMMHFGERDEMIPAEDVERIKSAHPDTIVHCYPADHGFNCGERGSFDPEAARLAWTRTIDHMDSHLA